MNLRNFCFIITFALSTFSQVHGMWSESSTKRCTRSGCGPLSFTIKTGKLNLLFRHISLKDLAKEDKVCDRATLMKHIGDFDAIQSMLGTPVACAFKALHFISPETVLETYLAAYAAKYKKMPEERKILHFWFIEDLNQENEFMGTMNVSTYIDQAPAKYNFTDLLELALTLAEKYRNKGITSQLAVAVHKRLSTFEPFKNGLFCFDTRTDNVAMQKIATKLGAELIHSGDKPLDFGIIDNPDFPSYTIPCDLFIIPRQ